jgi:hypothetical protein
MRRETGYSNSFELLIVNPLCIKKKTCPMPRFKIVEIYSGCMFLGESICRTPSFTQSLDTIPLLTQNRASLIRI